MATEIKWIKNDEFLVVIIPGRAPITLTAGTPDFKSVSQALRKKAYGRARKILDAQGGLSLKGVEVTPVGEVVIDEVVQDPIISQLIARFKEDGASYAPLIALGRKISKIESPYVREQLSRFLQANKVSITPDGCFLAYKGVTRNAEGKLVDIRTGEFDNSIGAHPRMKRSDVNPDPHVTCSSGLHVAALGYLGQIYAGNVHIVVKVDPRDVVSVPYDYQDQKIRTCGYTVLGLLDGNKEFEDVIAPWASGRAVKDLARSIKEAAESNRDERSADIIISIDRDDPAGDRPTIRGGESVMQTPTDMIRLKKLSYEELQALPAKKIVEHVLLKTGKAITCSIKSKERVLKKACELLGVEPTVEPTVVEIASKPAAKAPVLVVSVESTKPLKLGKAYDFGTMSAREIVTFVKKATGKDMTANLKNKQRIIAQAEKLMREITLPITKQQRTKREIFSTLYGGVPTPKSKTVKAAKAPKIKIPTRAQLEKMTGSEIIQVTSQLTGVFIPCSPKSKKSVLRHAEVLLGALS